MKIRTWHEFHKTQVAKYKKYPQYYSAKNVEEEIKRVEDKRSMAKIKFPHGLVLEGDWPEYDVATRWCWQKFGPKNGECVEHYSEYPACPLVLETKNMLVRPSHISEEDWDDDYEYKNPGSHSHEGMWDYCHFAKTGYDHGYGEYCFSEESDRDSFAAVVETLGYGERYQ